jgi:hypothetical protein
MKTLAGKGLTPGLDRHVTLSDQEPTGGNPMRRWPATLTAMAVICLATASCSHATPPNINGAPGLTTASTAAPTTTATSSASAAGPSDQSSIPPASAAGGRTYPQHTGIVATTFWVGEIFDPNASDGSQVISTYDSHWAVHYGGCDGNTIAGACTTEPRTVANGYLPSSMTPKENPFYLDLPFDDVNDPAAFARRATVIPWAQDPGYAGRETDRSFSYMKNRWVQISNGTSTCYGQVQDAGPGKYNDADYVFGGADSRPSNTKFNSAGADVSPALNGCLGFSDINGQDDRINWRFVEFDDVPEGPWRTIITTSQVTP